MQFLTLALIIILLFPSALFAAPNAMPHGETEIDYIIHLKKKRDGWVWETPGNHMVWTIFMEQADSAAKAKDYRKQLALLEAALEHANGFIEHDPRRAESVKKLKECAEKQGHKVDEREVKKLILPPPSSQPKYKMRKPPRTTAFPNLETTVREADLWVVEGKVEKAEPAYVKALKSLRERHVKDWHLIVKIVDRLTRIYYKQGRFIDAEILVRKELKDRESMHDRLDDTDPDKLQLAFLLGDLALAYSGHEKYYESEALYKAALKIINRHVSEKGYDYIVTLAELARIHKLMGQYKDAEKEFRTALSLSKDHCDVSKQTRGVIMGNYAKLLKKMGKNRMAEEVEMKALDLTGSGSLQGATEQEHYR